MHDESNRLVPSSAATHTAADFRLTTPLQLVLCLPEDRQILKNPLSLGPRAPARGPRGAPPAVSSSSLLLPPFRFRFRSYIRPALRRRSRRSPVPHRLMYTRRLSFLNIRKAPAGEGWEPEPAGARSAWSKLARGQAPHREQKGRGYAELRRTPPKRSSKNFPSTHSGE